MMLTLDGKQCNHKCWHEPGSFQALPVDIYIKTGKKWKWMNNVWYEFGVKN